MAELIRCTCTRVNDPWRRFCGGCGLALAPACGSCGFVNGKYDRFCGGCGSPAKVDFLTAGSVRGVPVRVPPSKPHLEQKTMPINLLEDL